MLCLLVFAGLAEVPYHQELSFWKRDLEQPSIPDVRIRQELGSKRAKKVCPKGDGPLWAGDDRL